MADNILDYDEGADAYDMGEDFDADKSQDWQNGWLEAAADDASID